MPGMSGFEQSNAELANITQEQQGLRAAVDAGQLRMEAGVAQRAAQRCEQAKKDIDDWLGLAAMRLKRMPFGDNDDGNSAADRFDQAAVAFMKEMRDAQVVLQNMADTYRAAGRTVAHADTTSALPFQGHL